jgi:hypothetical protein
MNISEGPVLELGMGIFSTPVLHWLCLDQKRPLVSYDNNAEYFKQNQAFENSGHTIHYVEDWDKIDIERKWGVVFIDHSPDSRRQIEAKRVANLADYVILHDSEGGNESKFHFIEAVFPLFKYRYDYKKSRVYTSVVSNFKEFKG